MNAILYYSHALVDVDDGVAWDIARTSALRNVEHGITGYLCFYNAHFFQYIEGEAKSLKNVFAQIHADSRHRIIQSHTESGLTHRRFPHWRMRYLHHGTRPETALECAITRPLDRSPTRHSLDGYWGMCLEGAFGAVSQLHTLGECSEPPETPTGLH